MRQLFEHHDLTRVGHYASVLESSGILTLTKNDVDQGVGNPTFDCMPQLWVMDDSRYDEACAILRELEAPDIADAGER